MKEVFKLLDQDSDKLISFGDLRKLFDKDLVDDDSVINIIRQISGLPTDQKNMHEEGISFIQFLIFSQIYSENRLNNTRSFY